MYLKVAAILSVQSTRRGIQLRDGCGIWNGVVCFADGILGISVLSKYQRGTWSL